MYDWQKLTEEFRYYLKIERSLSINTQEAYLTDCRRFALFMQEKYPDVTPQDILPLHADAFVNSLLVFKGKDDETKLLQAASQMRIIQSLRAFFKYLLVTDVIQRDIGRLLDVPKLPQKLPEILSDSEIRRMIDAIDASTYFGYRNKTIIELMYATGLRVSELVNLKFENIVFNEEYLIIKGKGDKVRYVPAARKVLDGLKVYIDKYRSDIEVKPKANDYVFISYKLKSKMTRQFVNKMLNETALKAGISKKIHPHILRHSFATELIRSGANLIAVKEMLGHSSVRTTEVYINLKTSDLTAMMEKCHPFYRKD
ncbi:MAG: tyrosine-type recombinase/integrase [Bacteroidales bacterium]|nr:tyrosine-type recombinase/integrase [Bacteroidales bacterium]